MFSYRHIYHAGNFADVVKHVTLTLLLAALRRKDTPFYVHDTHAGIGRYDLQAPAARQNEESAGGIQRLRGVPGAPAAVADYLAAVEALNPEPGRLLRHYPGSPRIARHFLRPADRLLLTELNPRDCASLRQEFAGDRQVEVYEEDAYRGLKAHLPPRERRGLVLIDPAYELKDEYTRLVAGLQEGYRRWATGVFAVWYPILSRSLATRFHDQVAASGIRRILRAELTIQPDRERTRMNGSGMLIVNPPWQLDARLGETLPWLWEQLVLDRASGVRVDWLVPE